MAAEALDPREDNVVDMPEEDVDLDLDVEGEKLRQERVGETTNIKVGGHVIHIRHAGAWPGSAMRAAGQGDWDGWADGVIDDPEELKLWYDLDLENYQIEAIFQKCGQNARVTMGKSQRRSGSRTSTRKR